MKNIGLLFIFNILAVYTLSAQCNNTGATLTGISSNQMICEGDSNPVLSATAGGSCNLPCTYAAATCSAVVTVEICHSYMGDLDQWYLETPGGTRVQMNAGNPSGSGSGNAGGTCTDVFGDSDNTFIITFDTENGTPFPSSPVSGSTYTLENETSLNGEDINEAGWSVWVFDCIGGDDGNIVSVSINFDCPSCTPSIASYNLNQTATIEDGACSFTTAVPVIVPGEEPYAAWFADVTGGTILNAADTDVYTPTDNVPGTYDYFVQVACSDPTIECPIATARQQVDLTIVDLPAIMSATDACASGAGTIDITADAAPINGAWEYSVDGTTWQSSGSFTGLADGSYTPIIRNTMMVSCAVSGSAITIACSCNNPCFTEWTAAGTTAGGCATPVSAMTPCDDGNPMTINDMEVLGTDGTTECTPCAGTTVSCSDPTTTQACNDNNPCTINDMETVITAAPSIVCVPCAGTAVDCSTAGQTTTQACDDGDACTINDMETTLTCDGSVCIPCAGTAITPPQPSIDNCVITVNQCDGTVNCMFHDNNPDTAGSSTPIITGPGAAYITDAIGTFDPSSAPMNVPLTIILNYEDPGTGCLGAPATCVITVVSGHAASAGNISGN